MTIYLQPNQFLTGKRQRRLTSTCSLTNSFAKHKQFVNNYYLNNKTKYYYIIDIIESLFTEKF